MQFTLQYIFIHDRIYALQIASVEIRLQIFICLLLLFSLKILSCHRCCRLSEWNKANLNRGGNHGELPHRQTKTSPDMSQWNTSLMLYFTLLSWSAPTVVKRDALFSLPMLFWPSVAQKHIRIFHSPDCVVRNSRCLWESFTHSSSAHTAFAFTVATAATNPNWTWAFGMGRVDARCILKLERSPRTPSQGCHFVMHYAYMQMPDKEMNYLKGHLWFSAQRYIRNRGNEANTAII